MDVCRFFFVWSGCFPAILNFCADVVRMSSLHQAFGKKKERNGIYSAALFTFFIYLKDS